MTTSIRKQISFDTFRRSLSLTPLSPSKSQQTIESAPSVDLKKYNFQFERIMVEPEAYQCFLHFVQKSHCENELLFIEAVNHLEFAGDRTNKRRIAIDIYKRFIDRDSDNEINLSGDIRNRIEKHFTELIESEDKVLDGGIFLEAKLTETKLIKDNQFAMFKKSNVFNDFLRKRSTSYLEKLAVPRSDDDLVSITLEIPSLSQPPAIAKQEPCVEISVEIPAVTVSTPSAVPYILDPTESPNVSDKDIAFIIQSTEKIKDDSFVKQILINQPQCYISRKTINLGHEQSNQMIMIIWRAYFDNTLTQVRNAIFDATQEESVPEKDHPITVIPAQQGFTKYSTSVTRRTVNYSTTTLSNRDYCLANTAVYDQNKKRIVIVNRSCQHPDVPVTKEYKRGCMIGGQIIQQESGGTSYTEVLFLSVNRNSWMTKKLFKRAYKTRSVELYKDIVARLNRSKQLDFPVPQTCNSIWHTLVESEKKQKEQTNRGWNTYDQQFLSSQYCII
jgi:hypothetical protein